MTVVPELAAGGRPPRVVALCRRSIEAGLRSFLTDGGFTAFTTNFEDLGGLRQLPGIAVQRLMADGYGFGGEGDWKTSVLLRVLKVMAGDRPGGTSFMEDYTYHFGPGEPKNPRCPHARGLPEHRLGQTKVRDPSLEHRRPRGSCPARFRRSAGQRLRRGPGRPRGPVPPRRQRHRGRPTRRTSPEAPGGAGRVEAGTEPVHLGGVLAERRRPASHGAQHRC